MVCTTCIKARALAAKNHNDYRKKQRVRTVKSTDMKKLLPRKHADEIISAVEKADREALIIKTKKKKAKALAKMIAKIQDRANIKK
jgi:hypothetical protein